MLSGLLNLGQSGLTAAQAWISVTGDNIANAETEGFSRRYVDQVEAGGINYRPGEQSLGVNARQVLRYFDQFLERSYVHQNTNSARWDEQDTIMATLENIFNESNRVGLNSSLNEFFNAWQDLALRPDDTATRVSLISFADNLSDMFGKTMSSIKTLQEDMNVSIKSGVTRVNEIAKAISELNRQITMNTLKGVSNPNSMLDERDKLVRELSTYVNVETIDKGLGEFRVQLTTGQPLVDGINSYSLSVEEPRSERRVMPESEYKGDIQFEGEDGYEYTVEVVEGGDITGGDTPKFRVSLDGGRNWLRNEDGSEMRFDLTDNDGDGKTDPVLVKNLKISFTEVDNFHAGDKFDIIPKDGLYWIEPTHGPQNITPQIYLDGQDNKNRLIGGKLTAYFNIRDDNCNRYMDELNAVASSLIWEVNRLHTQGSGLDHLTYMQGQTRVEYIDQALGSPQAVLPFANKLTEGNVNFHFYDAATGDYLSSAKLDFTPFGNVDENFDPSTNTLEQVRDAFNAVTVDLSDGTNIEAFSAVIQDNKLIVNLNPLIPANNNISFALGTDTTGIMSALGLNTFFAGNNATNISVNSQVHANTNLVAASQVNGQFQVNEGDNATAVAIGALSDKPVTITTFWKTVNNQSISEYYANLVSTVGADRRLSKTNSEYHDALTSDLLERSQSVSGVNMDEEMANLIKYQHTYTAAAKLITTADQMLQTLLGLKQ